MQIETPYGKLNVDISSYESQKRETTTLIVSTPTSKCITFEDRPYHIDYLYFTYRAHGTNPPRWCNNAAGRITRADSLSNRPPAISYGKFASLADALTPYVNLVTEADLIRMEAIRLHQAVDKANSLLLVVERKAKEAEAALDAFLASQPQEEVTPVE